MEVINVRLQLVFFYRIIIIYLYLFAAVAMAAFSFSGHLTLKKIRVLMRRKLKNSVNTVYNRQKLYSFFSGEFYCCLEFLKVRLQLVFFFYF